MRPLSILSSHLPLLSKPPYFSFTYQISLNRKLFLQLVIFPYHCPYLADHMCFLILFTFSCLFSYYTIAINIPATCQIFLALPIYFPATSHILMTFCLFFIVVILPNNCPYFAGFFRIVVPELTKMFNNTRLTLFI